MVGLWGLNGNNGNYQEKLPAKAATNPNYMIDEDFAKSDSMSVKAFGDKLSENYNGNTDNNKGFKLNENFYDRMTAKSATKADTNNDGQISRGERTVHQADKNGDNLLNRTEFTDFCRNRMPAGLSATEQKDWEVSVNKRFDQAAGGGTTINAAQADKIDWTTYKEPAAAATTQNTTGTTTAATTSVRNTV